MESIPEWAWRGALGIGYRCAVRQGLLHWPGQPVEQLRVDPKHIQRIELSVRRMRGRVEAAQGEREVEWPSGKAL